MKRVILLVLAVTFMACGGSKTIRDSRKVIKGNWTLSDISYSKSGQYNVTLLDDASKSCFEGSTWQFIPNNNTGMYSINKYACEAGDRHFIFTIDEIDETTGLYDFLLKPTDEKGKSQTNKGFRLSLTALSDSQMQWQQTVIVDNQPFTISMNFKKI
ncbi:lipocalin family protein [Aestuariibaculum sediminum]|uniref:Lipocalin family protein n=1 Tax=Aestuariibaculum sediminum TaxID=2770637 RepID=A0A8J6PYX4_9FLAO|nr:lipocalin family protein [Aestuariibaculum sediminum]MBD0831397.1 lipocalin family protein [Aestuariibaculum sediminum]